MDECDIAAWVQGAPDAVQRELRQAVHTVLVAIGGSSDLQPQMIMKGGILLAIRYESSRYTRDIDFSTAQRFADFDEQRFRSNFEGRLAVAVEELDYGVDCRLQSYSVKPRRSNADFQTIQMTLGYAEKGTKKHSHLLAKNCPDVVDVDYSFNEQTESIDQLRFSDGTVIYAYSFVDLVAEKMRALLQQEVRNRVRRQDAYDLFRILKGNPVTDEALKGLILDALKSKATSRGLTVQQESMANKEIIERSKKEYPQLADEILEDLPPFDEVYGFVRSFYESLPW
mgnify:FL=1